MQPPGYGFSAVLVIHRLGKIADLGHKQGKGFGKQAIHLNSIVLGVRTSSPGWVCLLAVHILSFDASHCFISRNMTIAIG